MLKMWFGGQWVERVMMCVESVNFYVRVGGPVLTE